MFNRRRLLQGAAALALGGVGRSAFAQDEPPVPIVFVHGDSDLAATWETQIWRFESNGYPRDRLFAISFTDPQARDDDTVAQANRSSTEDQLRELTAFIDGVKAKTGAPKVAIVASSRGGYATREYAAANPGRVEKAALGGTPNHGVWATDYLLGSEYNGRGPFLTKLDAGDTEVTPGVPFLTLRSDGFDLYAQPDGAIVFHKPGMALNVTADGPALKGATNVLLGQIDHRDTALSPVAFADIYRFITGRAPSRIAITPEPEVVLNGRVTGVVAGTPTNRPVEGAKVDVYRVSADTGERQGAPALSRTTGADGVWGPATFDPTIALEFVVAAPGAPVTHIYRSPLPRSFAQLDLRPAATLAKEDSDAAAIVRMDRPRGYFGLPRDIVLLDGKEPTDIPHGVPAAWHTTVRLPSLEDRPIVGEFNEERIVARPWPAKEGHMTILELTG
jgi:pimeloyl-ACP methyl ester carboxylesterase